MFLAVLAVIVVLFFSLSGFHKEKNINRLTIMLVSNIRIQHMMFMKQVAEKRDKGEIFKTVSP